MKTYAVHEIFYSLQGEGAYTGTPMTFVRFYGCNLSCEFCDTSQREVTPRMLTADQIINEIIKAGPALTRVCLTGGEPLLQVDDELARALGNLFTLHLETNGTFPLPQKGYFYHVVCSPKRDDLALPAWDIDEVRFSYTKEREEEILSMSREYSTKSYLYVSPINRGLEVDVARTKEAIQFCLENKQFRLSTQMHKLWRIQ